MPSILDKRTGKRYEIAWDSPSPPSREVMRQLINEQENEPDHTPDLATAWKRLNTSIVPALEEDQYINAAERNIAGEPGNQLPFEAGARKFASGMFKGTADVAKGFTSPLGIVTALASAGVGPATLEGALPAARALRGIDVAAGTGFAAEGAHNVYEGKTLAEKLMGLVQMGSGVLGVRSGIKGPNLSNIRGPIPNENPIPNVEPIQGPVDLIGPRPRIPYTPGEVNPALNSELQFIDEQIANKYPVPSQPIMGSRGGVQSPQSKILQTPAEPVGNIEPVRQFEEPLVLTPEQAGRNVDPLASLPMKPGTDIVAPDEVRFSDLIRDAANKEKQGRISRNAKGQYYIKPRKGEGGKFVGNKPFTIQDMLDEWEKEATTNIKALATGSNPQDVNIVFGKLAKNVAKLMAAKTGKLGIKGAMNYDQWKQNLPHEYKNLDESVLRMAYNIGNDSASGIGHNPTLSSLDRANTKIDDFKVPEPVPGIPRDITNPEKMSETQLSKWENRIGVPRSLITSMDLSFPGRQGMFLAVRNPKMAKQSFQDMIKAGLSEEGAKEVHKQIMQRQLGRPSIEMLPNGAQKVGPSFYEKAGLEIVAREEAFPSDLAFKIPIAGKGVKHSAFAYTAAANRLRADRFDDLYDKMIKAGFDPEKDLEAFKKAAGYVNTATGRTSLGRRGNAAAEFLSTVMFAPRFAASRIVLMNPVYYAKLPKVVRGEAIKDAAAFYGMVGSTLLTAKSVGLPVEVTLDPRSSDFGKIKIGDTRIDVGIGFPQFITFFTRMATKKVKYGNRVLPLEATKLKTRGGLATRFARSKSAPAVGATATIAEEEFFSGDKFNPKEVSSWAKLGYENVTPLFFQDVIDQIQADPKLLPLVAPLAFLGIGVTTYQTGKRKTKSKFMKNIDKSFDENVVNPISDALD